MASVTRQIVSHNAVSPRCFLESSVSASPKCSVLPSCSSLFGQRRGVSMVARHGSLPARLINNSGHSWTREPIRQSAYVLRATAEGDQPVQVDQVEKVAEEARQELEEAVESVKTSAADTANDSPDGPEKAKELLLTAAQELKDQAGALRSQASAEQSAESAEELRNQINKTMTSLKAEAGKASNGLEVQRKRVAAQTTETVQETAGKAKESLRDVAENSPDGIKDIAEVAVHAHSKEAAKKGAVIHDFCLGIPYGALLAVGGLVWFLIAGSTDALRFGTFLGGISLAISIQSLRIWQEGKSTTSYIVAQAVIAFVLLIKQGSKFFQTGVIFPTAVSALTSALMVGFYSYVVLAGGPPMKKQAVASSS